MATLLNFTGVPLVIDDTLVIAGQYYNLSENSFNSSSITAKPMDSTTFDDIDNLATLYGSPFVSGSQYMLVTESSSVQYLVSNTKNYYDLITSYPYPSTFIPTDSMSTPTTVTVPINNPSAAYTNVFGTLALTTYTPGKAVPIQKVKNYSTSSTTETTETTETTDNSYAFVFIIFIIVVMVIVGVIYYFATKKPSDSKK